MPLFVSSPFHTSTNLLHISLFPSFPHFNYSLSSADWSPSSWSSCSPLSLVPCPLWSLLCRPSFSGSVWCVSLWSFCATVHPVDRKHPVHHHSQLPVGSAGSDWPICVIFCQITGVWHRMIRPSPNHLPGERGREAGERKGAGWTVSLCIDCSALGGLSGAHTGSPLLASALLGSP